MCPMTAKTVARVRPVVVAVGAALSALAVCHKVFLWAFIKYWEWQHDGRRMKFTFWADERALSLAIPICGGVFLFTLRYLHRRYRS